MIQKKEISKKLIINSKNLDFFKSSENVFMEPILLLSFSNLCSDFNNTNKFYTKKSNKETKIVVKTNLT